MVTTDADATVPGTPRLVLASASAGRLGLLRNAGLDPEVVVSGVDESAYRADSPAELTVALAQAKARAVAGRMSGGDTLVVGCDSMLALDGAVLGKPADAADAVRRWQRMRGRSGTLVTGHCVVAAASGVEHTAAVRTTVHFGTPSDDEVEAYVATGEPERVAGAFTIDGLGGPFVEGVEGDWSNVVGLSLPAFRCLLAAHGVRLTDLWRRVPARP
ncbi:MAG TPA: nucleoside triphosphate pyrophosphatase [Streptosporangiales bacterium]